MTKKKLEQGLSRPLIAGVIAGGVSAGAVKKAMRDGADCLELRIDTFKNKDRGVLVDAIKRIRSIKEAKKARLLITVRSKKEGGVSDISDAERVGIYRALMPFVDMADCELSSGKALESVINSARRHGKKVVVSYHNFKGTPSDRALRGVIRRARRAGADLVKIATAVKDVNDLKRLANILVDYEGLIVIGMGDLGAGSRVFFPMLGSAMTYGVVTVKTAPGQLTVKEIRQALRQYL